MNIRLSSAFVALTLWLQVGAARDFEFKIPLDALKAWQDDVVVTVPAQVAGHSGVHQLQKDCEMHFGGTVKGYSGDPDGWVFGPMNVCVQPFFGKKKLNKADWMTFGDRIVSKGSVSITGVPRIWPEHLSGGNEDSNPNHAMEIHPITTLVDGSTKRDFRSFIFAPDGMAGISEGTQQSILDTTTVTVKKDGDMVVVTMQTGGLIGNFADIDVSISPKKITALSSGHRMEGDAEIEGGGSFAVRMVSVGGSALDQRIAKAMTSTKVVHLEVLALFSLSPPALLEAVQAGGSGKVQNPLQLILYGETDLSQ